MFRTTSFSASGQEQGIHQYIPPHLKRMFYKNPARIHASHNGLDPYGFSTNGLVLYLPLWALKDSSFKSVDAYNHTATATGASCIWGPTGRAFDGTEDYVNCGSASSLDIAGAFTVEAWVNAVGGLGIISKRTADTGFHIRPFGAAEAEFRLYQGDNAAKSAYASFALNVWQHLVGVYNGSNQITAYGNGSAGTPVAVVGYSPADAENLTLGKYSHIGGTYFEGLIGEARIYSRALSAGEITHNYNCTKSRYQ